MTSRSTRVLFTFSGGAAPASGPPAQETSSTRRRIQDVLGQARATLRQSQQFRNISSTKDPDLSAKLQFTQKPNDDFWSGPNPGVVVVKQLEGSNEEDSLSHSGYQKVTKSGTFHTPFHNEARKGVGGAGGKSARKNPLLKASEDDIHAPSFASDSSSTISLMTADLKGTSESSDSEDASLVEVQSSKSSTTKSPKDKKKAHWEDPVAVKLTPLPEPRSQRPETDKITVVEAIGVEKSASISKRNRETEEFNDTPRNKTISGKAIVQPDDMGFMRAQVSHNTDDPHWFEKALLTRGEAISEAAYDAFKEAQTLQVEKLEADIMNKNVAEAVSITKGKTLFKNVSEPEYTADWISDVGGIGSLSEIDMPRSEYLDDTLKDTIKSISQADVDWDPPTTENDLDTESAIKTATELENSGILEHIVENLHSVLEISDHPELISYKGLTPEEKSFVKEYEEAMLEPDEPLQSIFVEESEYADKSNRKGSSASSSTLKKDKKSSVSLSQSNKTDVKSSTSMRRGILMDTKSQRRTRVPSPDDAGGDKDFQDETGGYTDDQFEYDSSFVQLDSTEKSVVSKSIDTMKTPVPSRRASERNKSSTVTNKSSAEAIKKPKSKTTSSLSSSSKQATSLTKPRSKSKTVGSVSSTAGRRLHALPIPLDPPTSRHQKNIQQILEKEVYQKEVKRIRAEKLKEEKTQEHLKRNASKVKERNSKQTWKEPNYTEILLPDLFRYKSVSGLNAAKAKKTVVPEAVNYGAPYFELNGAVAGEDGTDAMLAAARVETLDIPDLVREVLASNERMYKMTVKASEQLANKAYRLKHKKEMSRQPR